MAERTIFLHGFSKAFAMTGWRIGYACGPAALIDAMMKVHQYTMLCASIIAQEAALEALKHGWDSVLKMREQYHRRRDLIVRRFNEIGLTCHSPRGSFYAFPSVTSTGLTEKEFATGLLTTQRLPSFPVALLAKTALAMFVRVSLPPTTKSSKRATAPSGSCSRSRSSAATVGGGGSRT